MPGKQFYCQIFTASPGGDAKYGTHLQPRQQAQAGSAIQGSEKISSIIAARNNLVNHPRKIVSINGTWYMVCTFWSPSNTSVSG
jgi:hypothetical protein